MPPPLVQFATATAGTLPSNVVNPAAGRRKATSNWCSGTRTACRDNVRICRVEGGYARPDLPRSARPLIADVRRAVSRVMAGEPDSTRSAPGGARVVGRRTSYGFGATPGRVEPED